MRSSSTKTNEAPSDDFALLFEALGRLDQHHQDLARQILEAIALRAEANRWQQQPA